MLVLPHAVTAGASLYIEQEYLIAGTAILREVAKFLTAMILAHAQFVLRTPVDTFEFVRHVILEGGATAKETPVAEAEPDAIAESGPQPKVSIFRKTNCACAKIIAVRNFATSRKIAVSQSRLDLISILALSLAFHAITLERSGFKENPTNFWTSIARWVRDSIFRTNRRSRSEM